MSLLIAGRSFKPTFCGTCPRPQLPLLPLGVDQNLLERRSDQLPAFSSSTAIGENDVCSLVGRLSFLKGLPSRHVCALKAARRCGCRLHFVMASWFPGGETDHSRYKEAARLTPRTYPCTSLMARIQMSSAALGRCRYLFVVGRQSPGNLWSGSCRSDGGRCARGCQ